MPLLAFDTAANACSVAVWDGGHVVAHASERMERGHAEKLVPLIQVVMADAGVKFDGLEALAVTTGPGSFTGIRIGLATAKSLVLAADLPLFGLSTFDVHAATLAPQVWENRPVLVALETKRDDLYLQLYGRDQKASGPPAAVESAGLTQFILEAIEGDTSLTLAGDGAPRALEIVAAESDLQLVDLGGPPPDARHLAALADSLRSTGQAPQPAEPFYLRPPDVRRPAERG